MTYERHIEKQWDSLKSRMDELESMPGRSQCLSAIVHTEAFNAFHSELLIKIETQRLIQHQNESANE